MTTRAYEIPLSGEHQAFDIALGGKPYRLALRYHDVDEGGWILDIADGLTRAPIVSGIPVVMGTDLLTPYPDKEFGGALIAWSDNSDDPPTYENLGDVVQILFVPAEAIA
jgi:hypothetical protein